MKIDGKKFQKLALVCKAILFVILVNCGFLHLYEDHIFSRTCSSKYVYMCCRLFRCGGHNKLQRLVFLVSFKLAGVSNYGELRYV